MRKTAKFSTSLSSLVSHQKVFITPRNDFIKDEFAFTLSHSSCVFHAAEMIQKDLEDGVIKCTCLFIL